VISATASSRRLRSDGITLSSLSTSFSTCVLQEVFRLIPSFFAELFDWNLAAKPTDAEFVFTPPEGAKKVELKAAQ